MSPISIQSPLSTTNSESKPQNSKLHHHPTRHEPVTDDNSRIADRPCTRTPHKHLIRMYVH